MLHPLSLHQQNMFHAEEPVFLNTFQTKKRISYNTDKRYSLQRPEVPSGMCQKVIPPKVIIGNMGESP